MEYTFGRNKETDGLIETWHYSHRLPANVQFVASETQENIPVATCYFSIPPTRWSEQILELSRLVRNDETEPKPILTKLISVALKQINRDKKFNLIVSFADSTQGHHGGIYQACSWNFHTMRKPSHDGFIIEGKFVPRRTCYGLWGTSSRTELVEILNKKETSCIPHFDNGKYLYWKALDRNGEEKAKRLLLRKSEYPKPKEN